VPCDNNNEDGFEEEQEDISINIMVQNILSFKQIYDYFENAITMAPSKDFKPLGLFQDIDREELNFPLYFLVNFIATKELKSCIKQLLNGNSCTKTIILSHTYQACFLKL
jgi:hypothetical protein